MTANVLPTMLDTQWKVVKTVNLSEPAEPVPQSGLAHQCRHTGCVVGVWCESVCTCMYVAEAELRMHSLSPGVMSACSTVIPIPKYCSLVVAMRHTCTLTRCKRYIYYTHHMEGLAGLGVRCHLTSCLLCGHIVIITCTLQLREEGKLGDRRDS